jgi:DNA-binding NarL/FixJ family response regulator
VDSQVTDAELNTAISSLERQVLRLASEGRTDDEIAQELLLEPGVVRQELRSAVARLAALRSPDRNGQPRSDGDEGYGPH